MQSALYYHGMIIQIPVNIYAVTLDRSKVVNTTLATISFHHIQPAFFFGFSIFGKYNVKMATPEKALIDYFYLTQTRTNLFRALPELTLPETFNRNTAKKIIARIPYSKRRSLVEARLKESFR